MTVPQPNKTTFCICHGCSKDPNFERTYMLWRRVWLPGAFVVYRCLHGLAPSYLPDSFLRVTDVESRRRLRSASTDELIITSMRLSTVGARPVVGDRAFHVAAARTWNSLPLHVTSAPSLPILKRQLKTALFTRSYPDCAARA